MSNKVYILPATINEYRQKCEFKNIEVQKRDEHGKKYTYPCICLWDNEIEVPIYYTGLERYLFRFDKETKPKRKTLAKRAYAVCHFLNYLLWNTKLNSIHECNINVIRKFLVWLKEKEKGIEYPKETWMVYWNHLADFLESYYENNEEVLDFKYSPEKLRKEKKNQIGESYDRKRYDHVAMLHLSTPVNIHHKNRYLVEGYFELLLYEAKKWDRELALGIGLGGYSGLREGEVVNTTLRRIRTETSGPYGSVSRMHIDLLGVAPHFENWEKKTDPGSIKKLREQEVYMPLVPKIKKLLDEHLEYHCLKGYDISDDAPLFVNKWGRPLTVQAYSARVKKLFYDHFLPDLKASCIRQNSYAENAAFIEAYESEYPGLHMLRHWYTMYLREVIGLSDEDVQKYRGDDSAESFKDYIHVNSEMINLFTQINYIFQVQILEAAMT